MMKRLVPIALAATLSLGLTAAPAQAATCDAAGRSPQVTGVGLYIKGISVCRSLKRQVMVLSLEKRTVDRPFPFPDSWEVVYRSSPKATSNKVLQDEALIVRPRSQRENTFRTRIRMVYDYGKQAHEATSPFKYARFS